MDIEGPDVVSATEELLQIPGLEGHWDIADDGPQKAEVLTTVATIVAITIGTVQIAEKIYQWYQKLSKKEPTAKIDKVMLIGRNGERILLKNASVEQIRRLLEP